MGLFPSKVQDALLAEKLQNQKEAAGDADGQVVLELRRNNSLVLGIEDYMDGKAENVEPEKDEKAKKKKEGGHAEEQKAEDDVDDEEKERLLNPRKMLLEKLITSVAMGDFRALREQVIQHLATINRRFEGKAWSENTLLHVAAREGYTRMVEYETDPKSHSIFEVTEVEVNMLNKRKRTPLHLAFSPPQLTYCGQRFGVVNNKAQYAKPESLESLSDWEKPGGHAERHRCIVALLKNKADPNILDFQEYSPLQYAAILGWLDTVEFLIDQGAKAAHVNILGQNVLHLACKYQHVDIVEYLLEHVSLKVNERDAMGETPLLYAIQSENVALVDILLDFGADVNMENYKKIGPLKLACEKNDAAIVGVLLDFNAPRDKTCFELLKGEAREIIFARVAEEEAIERKKMEAKKAKQEAARKKAVEGKEQQSAVGQWIPYKDKRGRGVFYYNKVSRVSQFEVPPDYVRDRSYVMKKATYGLSFYH